MKNTRKNQPARSRGFNRTCREEKGKVTEAVAEIVPSPAVQLRKILVPTDFSECSAKALDYAVDFAARIGGELTLLHVVEPLIYPTASQELPVILSDYQQDTVTSSRKELLRLRSEKVAGKVPAGTMAVSGHASATIVEVAKAIYADLIIIGTHGFRGLKHALLGSTAERVVRHAPCPVLTVRERSVKPA
ncbi:MAG: universal stress protein [Verrucomicrobiota bacterium]